MTPSKKKVEFFHSVVLKLVTQFNKAGTPPRCFSQVNDVLREGYEDDDGNTILHYLAGAQFCRRAVGSLLLFLKKIYRVPLQKSYTDNERAETVRRLHSQGIKLDFSLLNIKGQSVLHFCVLHDSIETLKVMIEIAFSPDYEKDLRMNLDQKDANNDTPLSLALKEGRFECVSILIGAGALDSRLQNFDLSFEAQPSAESCSEPKSPFRFQWKLNRKETRINKLFSRLESALRENARNPKAKVLLNEQEVFVVLVSDINKMISRRKSLDHASALTLLYRNQFDIESALSDPKPIIESQERVYGGETNCTVCDELVNDRNLVSLPCAHRTCSTCWRGIFRAAVDTGNVSAMKCPLCSLFFPLDQLDHVVDDTLSKKIKKLWALHYVNVRDEMKWCPSPDCRRALFFDPKDTDEAQTVRCACGSSFCWKCSKRSHEPASCSQAEQWQGAQRIYRNENETYAYMDSSTVRCPYCQAPVERDGGCNHINCANCRQSFCYACGKRWRGHPDHYSCNRSKSRHNLGVQLYLKVLSKLDRIFRKSVETSKMYQYYFEQYSKYQLNTSKYKVIASYMENLLEKTLPSIKTELSTSENVQALEYIRQAVEELFESARVSQHTYVRLFTMQRRSSRYQFLLRLEQNLERDVDSLRLIFDQMPGIEEISSLETIESLDFVPVVDHLLLMKQLEYCHALHRDQMHLIKLIHRTQNASNKVIQASRSGLLSSKKLIRQTLPLETKIRLLVERA